MTAYTLKAATGRHGWPDHLALPHTVAVHDILEEGRTEFIVMEHVQGKTLGQLIGPKGLALRDTPPSPKTVRTDLPAELNSIPAASQAARAA